MRELKFRYTYRRKDDGHIWQIISPIDGIEEGSGQIYLMRDNDQWELVARDMFAGLHDADGRDIFEGDILEYVLISGWRGIGAVYWADEGACFVISGLGSIVVKGGEKRVIGNIHESPELLTGDRG